MVVFTVNISLFFAYASLIFFDYGLGLNCSLSWSLYSIKAWNFKTIIYFILAMSSYYCTDFSSSQRFAHFRTQTPCVQVQGKIGALISARAYNASTFSQNCIRSAYKRCAYMRGYKNCQIEISRVVWVAAFQERDRKRRQSGTVGERRLEKRTKGCRHSKGFSVILITPLSDLVFFTISDRYLTHLGVGASKPVFFLSPVDAITKTSQATNRVF